MERICFAKPLEVSSCRICPEYIFHSDLIIRTGYIPTHHLSLSHIYIHHLFIQLIFYSNLIQYTSCILYNKSLFLTQMLYIFYSTAIQSIHDKGSNRCHFTHDLYATECVLIYDSWQTDCYY